MSANSLMILGYLYVVVVILMAVIAGYLTWRVLRKKSLRTRFASGIFMALGIVIVGYLVPVQGAMSLMKRYPTLSGQDPQGSQKLNEIRKNLEDLMERLQEEVGEGKSD